MEEMTLFDLFPADQAEKYKPQKSTDWKWSFKDYPKEKNGIKVFSCFACGGGSSTAFYAKANDAAAAVRQIFLR